MTVKCQTREREKKKRSMFNRTLTAAILPNFAALKYREVEMSYHMVERIPNEPFRLMAVHCAQTSMK